MGPPAEKNTSYASAAAFQRNTAGATPNSSAAPVVNGISVPTQGSSIHPGLSVIVSAGSGRPVLRPLHRLPGPHVHPQRVSWLHSPTTSRTTAPAGNADRYDCVAASHTCTASPATVAFPATTICSSDRPRSTHEGSRRQLPSNSS